MKTGRIVFKSSFAFNLSKTHTQDCGARSLDILHVGSALTLKANTFITNDLRQAQLAEKAGLKTINLASISELSQPFKIK